MPNVRAANEWMRGTATNGWVESGTYAYAPAVAGADEEVSGDLGVPTGYAGEKQVELS